MEPDHRRGSGVSARHFRSGIGPGDLHPGWVDPAIVKVGFFDSQIGGT